MPESLTATRAEIIAAIVALAGLLGYLLRELFKNNQAEKQQITKAYLSHVEAATAAMTRTADSISSLAEATNRNTQTVQKHCEVTQREHAAVLVALGLDPDRNAHPAKATGRRNTNKEENMT